MRKTIHFLMLSCKEAAGLIDKRSHSALSVKERVRLFMHTTLCNACKAYQKQSRFIEEALRHHRNAASVPAPLNKDEIRRLKDDMLNVLKK